MPWLVGTALMRSLAVTEKRGGFKHWTVLLAILAFSLVTAGHLPGALRRADVGACLRDGSGARQLHSCLPRRRGRRLSDAVRLREGFTERDVIDYMVARYGDFVLYRPPFKATTALLWIGFFVLMLAAVTVLLRKLRSRNALVARQPLTEADRQRAASLLRGAGVKGGKQ